MGRFNRGMVEVIFAPVNAELKELIWKQADAENLAINEYIAKIMAKEFKRPDLAAIPRKGYAHRRRRK
jgi:hypothetical protein